MIQFTDAQRETLRAVCDTVVPPLTRSPDPFGFFARKASDLHIQFALEAMITTMPPETGGGLLQLLDALTLQNFASLSLRSREQILQNLNYLGPQVAAGAAALTGLTLFLYYGLPDEQGQNPNWPAIGFPGPLSAPPQPAKQIAPLTPTQDTSLSADVVIIGSGAGGGVIAGELTAQGLEVVILEAGGYHDESDFTQLEIPAYQRLYWRGGPTPTADLNVSIQAGACLGGGTVVNWTNSLKTRPWVREEWEREYGLSGLTTDFDRHIDAVWQRLGVNRDCSQLNPSQQRMERGAQALGWDFTLADRNTDPSRYAYETAGYMGFGDQSGSKNSTLRTYLQDAADRGATIIVNCRVDTIRTQNGAAAGVQATYTDPATGARHNVTVDAPQVVLAAGSLESPAVLLRSGLGGPAAGNYLRLHPCTAVFGYYPEPTTAWQGAPHAGLVHEFENRHGDGYGFLLEGAQYTTAVAASAVPYTNGRDHKELMARYTHGVSFIGLLRDHGHGRITLDANGEATPTYALTDPIDLRNTMESIEAQVRLHEAAGAQQILAVAAGGPSWHFGQDLGAYISRIQGIPLRAGGWKLFAAHQMGSCRMGSDPQTSVANPEGELHDVSGVFVGDASAFPTSSGTNPMITTMALAHRTAGTIAAAARNTTATPAGATA